MDETDLKPSYALTYLVVALLAFVVFLPWIHGYFLADDWRIIARNTHVTPAQFIGSLLTLQEKRWYRPLYELSTAWSWSLFGLSPAGYHAISFALHALNAALIAALGQRLARDRRVGLLAGLAFAVLGCHPDAVLWIAGRNELLAAVFTLSSLASYVKFRDGRRRVWWVGALLFYIAGLMSKETAMPLPLFLVFYDLIFTFPGQKKRHAKHPDARRVLPLVPIAIVGIVYLLIRLQTGIGYDIQVNLLMLPKNLIYYLLMETCALPVSMSFLSRFPTLTPAVVVLLAIACALGAWLARRWLMCNRAVWFGALWMVFALTPVLPIVSERSVYVSSIGWAWIVAAVVSLAWEAASKDGSQARQWLVVLVIGTILGANLVTLVHRCYWWNRASDISQSVFSQIRTVLLDLPPEKSSQLWLFNLPEQYEYAHAFGNAFPYAASLLYDDLEVDAQVMAFLDTDTNASTPEQIRQLLSAHQAVEGSVVVLYWQGETLVASNIAEGVFPP